MGSHPAIGRPTQMSRTVRAAEIERVKADTDFMAHLHTLTERDREILDRLAQ